MSETSFKRLLPPPLSTLAIGSVPFQEPKEALDLMARTLDIPASPQMVQVSPWEDMILGAISGVPAVMVDEGRNVTIAQEGREDALAQFYEKYFSSDLDYFALGEKSSLGFEAFIARAAGDPSFGKTFLKTQVVGPLTFGQSVRVQGAQALVDSPDLLEAVALAIGFKTAWLAKRIRETGRRPIVFIDEPGLTGYGSAFSTLSPQTVMDTLGASITAARQGGEVLIGCHVCGNTDWGLLSRVGLDIINFDADANLCTVCLYPKEIQAFLEKGGLLAFGIVPTRDFTEETKPGHLAMLVRDGWATLASKNIDKGLLAERTLLTSACGLGSLAPEKATAILEALPEVSEILAESIQR
ncbi:MAG: hypothetical protein LBU69_03755 [Deltaproteobacteria bacterium]|jgi:hypothetical protein|nr:hypothetical protein [Deltaproteobacteria bacterium]